MPLLISLINCISGTTRFIIRLIIRLFQFIIGIIDFPTATIEQNQTENNAIGLSHPPPARHMVSSSVSTKKNTATEPISCSTILPTESDKTIVPNVTKADNQKHVASKEEHEKSSGHSISLCACTPIAKAIILK